MKKILLPLLCLCLFAVSTYAVNDSPGFKGVPKFDAKRLFDVKWYEQIYFTNTEDQLNGCPRDLFTPTKNGKIIYQYGQYTPGVFGDFNALTLTLKQQGRTGTFDIEAGDICDENFYILAFDPCYEWIVYGVDQQGTTGDAITVITQGPKQNLEAIQKGIDLAIKYGFDSHHLEEQSRKCNYKKIFWNLKALRKGL